MIKKILLNKRGEITLEQFLGILIGVICLVFLVGFGALMISNMINSQKTKEAKSVFESIIIPELQKIDYGNESQREILIPNPADWFILSFTGTDKKPNRCVGANCLCICEKPPIDFGDGQIKNCDDKGICITIPTLKKFDKIKIESKGTWILIKKTDEGVVVERK